MILSAKLIFDFTNPPSSPFSQIENEGRGMGLGVGLYGNLSTAAVMRFFVCRA